VRINSPVVSVLRRYPSFRYLFFGQTVSQLGSSLHRIALMWLVLELTGSGLKMGSVMMVYVIPWALFGVVAGTFVDRMDRRRIMIWADVARALVVASVPIAALAGSLTYSYLLVVSFVLSTISTLYQPARMALLPQVIHRRNLLPANSASQVALQLTNVAGPLLGGVLVGVMGSSNVFVLDALSYWSQVVASIRSGWAYVRGEAALLHLMGFGFFLNFAFAPLAILMPILAKEVFGAGAQGYGIMSAGWSAGMLLGAAVVGYLGTLRPTTAISWFFPIQGIAMGLAGFIGGLWGAAGAFLVAGAFNAMVNVLLFTAVQQLVPDDKLGRVDALLGTAATASQPLAYALSGWIADLAPVPLLLAGIGTTFVFAGVIASQLKPLRRFDEVHARIRATEGANERIDTQVDNASGSGELLSP